MTAAASAIYVGRLRHARFGPKPHAFAYSIYMLYLDLDELDLIGRPMLFGVEKRRPLSFRREDYLGDAARPLAECVREEVLRTTGVVADGPIRLLTQVRSFGYVFNPVSFYYCFAPNGRDLRAVLAEITNTPWNERHCYGIAADSAGEARGLLAKAFHVSPFFSMAQRYRWSFSAPRETLGVEMTNEEDGRTVFRAGLDLERRPLDSGELLRVALRHPLMSWAAHAAIYWQALRLWWKGAPVHTHPVRTHPERRTAHAIDTRTRHDTGEESSVIIR